MINELVSQIDERFEQLQNELSDPLVIGDRDRFTATSRAYRELEPAARLASQYRRVADDYLGARELLDCVQIPEVDGMTDPTIGTPRHDPPMSGQHPVAAASRQRGWTALCW